jgi:lipopolysaccharide biosynthesis protein
MNWARRWLGTGHPLVLDAQRSQVRVEADDEPHPRFSGRTAILAHWASDGRVGRSASELTKAVRDAGYTVVVVSTAPGGTPLDWTGGRLPGVVVLRRPNIGYDFGSWATALEHYPSIADSDHVLMLNDSLVGPFHSIEHLLDHFHASAADVWGLTDSTQFHHHLQSYCLGFTRQSLRKPPLVRFWRGIRSWASRIEVIQANELGLSRLLANEHFVTEAAIPYWRVVKENENPTLLGWRRLLDLGFPFVKRQLLLEPDVAPDGSHVRVEIWRRFGVRIDEWA